MIPVMLIVSQDIKCGTRYVCHMYHIICTILYGTYIMVHIIYGPYMVHINRSPYYMLKYFSGSYYSSSIMCKSYIWVKSYSI